MLLYKYVTMATFERIVASNSIRFSTPNILNDPFEFSYVFAPDSIDWKLGTWVQAYARVLGQDEEYRALLTHLAKDWEIDYTELNISIVNYITSTLIRSGRVQHEVLPDGLDQKIAENWSGTYESLRERYCILSLSERSDELLLWSHYGEDASGVLLALDSTVLLESIRQIGGQVASGRVEYTSKRPTGGYAGAQVVENFFKKPAQWSYEREWRIVLPITHKYLRQVPHIAPPLFLGPLSSGCVTFVASGPQASVERIGEIERLAADFGVLHVRAALDPQEYLIHVPMKA